MVWVIGDSFDWYSVDASEAVLLWDLGNNGFASNAAGRFAGSKSLQCNNNSATVQVLAKSSGSNDATHHIVVSLMQIGALGATTNCFWFTLFDGTTAQCSVAFRLDGSIILTSGASNGTILSTYSSAFSGSGVWTAFEFEITINNTTGAWHVRKDGATSDSFSASSLNTRGGTANNYANKIALGSSTNVSQRIDDFIWFTTSGAAPNTWIGDVRATQQMPITNSGTTQFSGFPNPANVGSGATSSSAARVTNTVYYFPFTPTWGGSFTTLILNMLSAVTGNMVVGIYDNTGVSGAPGTKLCNSSQITNPVAGFNTFSISGTLVEGTTYYFAVSCNAAHTEVGGNATAGTYSQAITYNATMPSTATVGSTFAASYPNFVVPLVPDNATLVNELVHNDNTDYAYDSTVGHGEFYNVAPLTYVPVAIVAVQTRAFALKSDAGARTLGIQMKSGTIVSTASLALSTAAQQITRVDLTDPNTGVAWTAAGVNAITVGPSLVA